MNLLKKSSGLLKASYSVLGLDPNTKFELDLGCGEGSFTVRLAEKFPDRTILAVDAMIGRLNKLLRRTVEMSLDNVIIIESDAYFFLDVMLPESSLERIHLLCPDPWPKKKHRFHRLFSSEFV
nr:hypothetical protein [Victivallales bacterium]